MFNYYFYIHSRFKCVFSITFIIQKFIAVERLECANVYNMILLISLYC